MRTWLHYGLTQFQQLIALYQNFGQCHRWLLIAWKEAPKQRHKLAWKQKKCNFLLGIGHLMKPPQWGAADAEIKVPSGENTELKCSPFKAWSRSVYSHICCAYRQGFFPCIFLPFWSIHLHFCQNLSRFLPCWLLMTHGSCVGPQNEIGHPVGCRFPALSAHGM